MSITDYECYQIYVALKMHFRSQTYDYIKYNGKVKSKYSSFEKRRDKHFFTKLAKSYKSKKELEDFFISNLIYNSKIWIGETLTDNSEEIYKRWNKKIQSLNYMFENECNVLLNDYIKEDDKEESFNNLFRVSDGQHPVIIKLVLSNIISIESFIIFNQLFKLIPRYNKMIKDSIVWPDFALKVIKYEPFLNLNVDKYKVTLKKVFD